MDIYRICKSEYAADLTGQGAKRFGGRWNRPGLAVLYTSQARSLALLELLVHFASKSALKQSYSFVHLSIEDQFITSIDQRKLPKGMISSNDERLWSLTDDYFIRKKVLALQVPSVLVPEENNILLNPNHIQYQKIKLVSTKEVHIDSRFSEMISQ